MSKAALRIAPAAAVLAGRVALVTGASSGVGRTLAKALAGAGARVALGARRVERLQALACEIEECGGEALAVSMDVEDETSIRAAYEAIEGIWSPPDVVIANAGVNQAGKALDLDAETIDWILRVNVRGAYLTAREAARRMVRSEVARERGGRVVLVASIAAHTVLPGAAAYCASKAGLVMLGRSLAREWANLGVNVNVVCPGFMPTEIVEEWLASEAGARSVGRFPRKRLMPAEDLNAAVIYLASDAARSVTGAILTIDDAQSL